MSDDNEQKTAGGESIRTWFVRDEPLPNLSTDEFAYSSYAEVITRTLEETDPPFTFGVFGTWGVGKSSVINEVEARLSTPANRDRYVFYIFDVWKYEGDSLRREFLTEFQSRLQRDSLISRKTDVIKRLYQATETTDPKTIVRRPKFWPLVISVLIAVVFASLLIAALNSFEQISTTQRDWMILIIIPVSWIVMRQFTVMVVTTNEIRFSTPPLFSAEQFENAFFELVEEVQRNKIVIVFDNLDRCGHDRVIEVLSSIKTFLEPKGSNKCMFLVPCDDRAIKQHVIEAFSIAEEPGTTPLTAFADEYLRKFFNSFIRIEALLPDEIERYVQSTMSGLKIFETTGDDEENQIVQMVAAELSDNPRKVKTYFNTLTSRVLIARSRESSVDGTPFISPAISDNIAFFAKVAILDVKYPDAYRGFSDDDTLYYEAQKSADGDSEQSDSVRKIFKNEPGLESFLRRSAAVSAENPAAFLRLKQTPDSVEIPNYSQIIAALRVGNAEPVLSVLESSSPGVAEKVLEVIRRQFQEWLNRGYHEYATATAMVWLNISENLAHGVQFQLGAKSFLNLLASDHNFLPRFTRNAGSERVIPLTELATDRDRMLILETVGETYASRIENEESQVGNQLLRLIVQIDQNPELFDREASRIIYDANAKMVNPDPAAIAKFEAEESRTKFVGSKPVVQVFVNTTTEELRLLPENATSPHSVILNHIGDVKEPGHANAVANRIVEWLNEIESSESEYIRFVIELVNKSVDVLQPDGTEAPSSVLTRIDTLIRQTDQELWAPLMSAGMNVYPISDAPSQAAFDATVRDHVISSSSASILGQVAVQLVSSSVSSSTLDASVPDLVRRILAHSEEEQIEMLNTFRNTAPGFLEPLEKIATEFVIQDQHAQGISAAELLIDGVPRDSNGRKRVSRVILSAIERLKTTGDDANRTRIIKFTMQTSMYHTVIVKDRLIETLIEILETSDTANCDFAIRSFANLFKSNSVTSSRRYQFLVSATEWLSEQQPELSDNYVSQLLPLIEGSVERIGLSASAKIDYDVWLMDRLSTILDADKLRETALVIEARTDFGHESLTDAIPKLVARVQHEPSDELALLIADTLVVLYEKYFLENEEIWDEFSSLRRELNRTAGSEREIEIGKKLQRVYDRVRGRRRRSK